MRIVAESAVLLLVVLMALSPKATLAQPAPKSVSAFTAKHCIDCHSGEESEAGLDLEQIDWQLSSPASFAKWVQVFDHVAEKKMPPADAEQPSDQERRSFGDALSRLLSDHELSIQKRVGRTRLRRMNRIEYENTVHDLLGIDIPLKEILPEETPAHGFDTVTDGLRISPTQIEQYLEAADRALDAAIRLTSEPAVEKNRYRYHDEKDIQKNLATPHGKPDKSGGTHRRLFHEQDDAIVFFSPSYSPNTLRQFSPPVDGTYRVRISAYGHNSQGAPVTLQVFTTDWKRPQLRGHYDMPADKPRTVSLDVTMTSREVFQIIPYNVGHDPDGKTLWNFDDLDDLDVPGLAVQWVEVEGPLIEQWPPQSVERLFGAEAVRKRDRRGPWTPQGHLEYELAPKDPRASAREVIERFAARAFRRSPPLPQRSRPSTGNPAATFEPYVALALAELGAGRSYEEAVRVGLRAVLVSPRFLVLDESPGQLDDDALASRLSYFLWSRMPDESLLEVAAKGALSKPNVFREQFNRLLSSPRSEQFVSNFVGQWLDLRSIDATSPDLKLYPEYDLLLRHSMIDETEAFFNELLQHDLPVRNLIDSDFVMLNSRLAEHYDIELSPSAKLPGESLRRVSVPEDSPRGGLLTHASVLKVTANGTVTSPVRRGTWVLSRLIGQPPSPPPPVPAVEPDTRGTTTIREQLAKHRDSPVCNSCHRDIDPPGFAMESFDVIGGYRERYRSDGEGEKVRAWVHQRFFWTKEGPAVDPSGQLADGREFAGIEQFKALLIEQEQQVLRSLTKNLVTYATGSPVQFADRKEVDRIVDHVMASGGGLRTLVLTIVESDLFQRK